MRRIVFLCAACCVITTASMAAQDSTCATLRAERARVYGFHPAQMSEPELEAKGKQIEAFWEKLHSAGSAGTACLKAMLAEEKTDHNFQFDAASALYQMDRSPEALNLVRDSIAQADFQEIDPAAYLSLALALSQNGVDIQSLAARLLRSSNLVIHIPEDSLDLDSDTAALFLYASMPSPQATKSLEKDLTAPESFVRSAAAHLLGEQLNEQSFRALSKWDGLSKIEGDFRRNDIQAILKYQPPKPADLEHPKFTREQVLKIISELPHTQKEFDRRIAEFKKQMRDKKATEDEISKAVADAEPAYGIANHTAFMNSAVATLNAEDLEILREARRKSLINVSGETLEEYLAFTQVMIGLINRLDLFKEYRNH